MTDAQANAIYDELIARIAREMQREFENTLFNLNPLSSPRPTALRCVGGRFEVVDLDAPPRCPRCGPVFNCSKHMT